MTLSFFQFHWFVIDLFVQGVSVQGVYVREVYVLGGICPGVKCPGGKCSGGYMYGGRCPRGTYRGGGGLCPRTILISILIWFLIVTSAEEYLLIDFHLKVNAMLNSYSFCASL